MTFPASATAADAQGRLTSSPETAAAGPGGAAVAGLLPPRAVVLDRLAELMPTVAARPITLLVVGLRRRDDGWPIPPAALDTITTRLARGLRADDWLARSGPTEFAVLVAGGVDAAQAVAARVLESVNTDAVRDMSASAGIAALEPGSSAGEVLRRGTLCLTTARTIGAGQIITYSGTR